MIRFAIRSLRRKPVFTAAAVLTIALALGANTALFGVIYAILIQPLPFRDPGKLVRIWNTHPALSQLQLTVPDFVDIRARAKSFDQVAAHTLSAMNTGTLLGKGEPEIVHAAMATNNLFSTMGIEPLTGRAFSSEEEREKQRVALLSENLWRHKFGADPSIVGKQIHFSAESFTVVGVIPQRQAFPEWADLWIPLSLIEPQLANRRKFHPLEVVARLKPGVTSEDAQFEMQAIARQAAQAYPETNGTLGAFVIPLAREATRDIRPALLLAWGAVALVLLIACANLAHLFMARMLERRQEVAIRTALGARTAHLLGQILMESVLVALLGGAIGTALGAWSIQFARHFGPSRVDWNGIDAPVWLFALALSVICGILFGLPACWQLIRGRARVATGRSIVSVRSPLSSVLIAAEVAMALLVLTGAALLTRTFAALLREDPGFHAERVLMVPNLPLREDGSKAEEFLETQLMTALRKVPGVAGVAAINSAPLTLGATDHSRFATRFGVEGRTFDPGSYPVAQNRWGSPDFFQVLGIPLKSGRWLNESDRNAPRIVINDALARRFFPGGAAVGKRLALGVMDPQQQLFEIVGVARDIRELGLDQEAEPTLYSLSTSPTVTLLIRTSAEPAQFATAIRDAIRSVDPAIPVTAIRPLEQNVHESLEKRRFALTLVGIFGGIAALLTAAGIFGLLAYSVNARVREFGVRAAVGATSGELVGMILREAALLTVPGFIMGLVLVAALYKVLKGFLYQLSPVDPISILSAALFLTTLTIAAAWVPARRAASVDPASALRAE
ncbi:MAG TPA: ABC transporter permease [Bryobacteraceae bacterium]|jgi:putative ABC transport system permease protein